MRTFIKTETAGLVDAASITDINYTGDRGGLVKIQTTSSGQGSDGWIVGRAMPESIWLQMDGSKDDTEAWGNQAAVLAESLLHAICRADAIAKKDGNGAIIRHNPLTTRWMITDLGKTAPSPEID